MSKGPPSEERIIIKKPEPTSIVIGYVGPQPIKIYIERLALVYKLLKEAME